MKELEELKKKIMVYSEEDREKIMKAYNLAESLHEGQTRQSGEPYIIHPLSVALIVIDLHLDADTVCAALLHDTLEDTTITKEEIIELFNKDVANLVDIVTKISRMNFSSKSEQNAANTRKIITGITNDVRGIMIKLADRLHNMRTLEFKPVFKQKENALETMEIFVPLAYYLGCYRIKSELEDLSLQYLKPDVYKEINEKLAKINNDTSWVNEMIMKIKNMLEDKNIPNEIKFRIKNIYGIYKRLEQGHKLTDIHDLYSLKIMVDSISNCYQTLGMVHSLYHPINSKFKDYICNPKTNKYQSLHTTVFAPNNSLLQTQIRTFEMDKVASFGLAAYWKNSANTREKIQSELKEKYQFFTSLIEINKAFGDNREFVSQIKKELLSEKIYVYTSRGEVIELPVGATIIDFAYLASPNIANTMIGAKVNDEYVNVNYVLNNKDIVTIITDELSFGPRPDWENFAITTNARTRIRDFNQRVNK